MKAGLSKIQIETIGNVLAPYADKIDRVAVFGSRAQGTHRDNSDLDLVIYGALLEQDIDRIWTLFQESSLPFSVDVKGYEQIQYAPLRAHIDRVQTTLLTHDELIQVKGAGGITRELWL